MKLAFWKGKRSRRTAPGPADAGAEPVFDSADTDADAGEAAALQLRVRTRRRLIGAGALLLAVVVLVPMLLDPTPRAVPDNIPIELPSDKTPFAPKLAPLAPEAAVPAEGAGAASIVPAAPGSAADAAAVAPEAPATTPPAEAAPAPKADGAHSAQAKKRGAAAGDPGKSDAKQGAHKSAAPVQGKIFVQAAALANESAAQELASRLTKSGLTPFVERADTSEGVRFRVRLGPFSTRGDAERSRSRLRALGVNSNIVGA